MSPEWKSSSPIRMNIGMASSTKLVFCSHTIVPTMSSERSRPRIWSRPKTPDTPSPTPTHTPAASRTMVIAKVTKIGPNKSASPGVAEAGRMAAQELMQSHDEAGDDGEKEDSRADQHWQHRNP